MSSLKEVVREKLLALAFVGALALIFGFRVWSNASLEASIDSLYGWLGIGPTGRGLIEVLTALAGILVSLYLLFDAFGRRK